MAHNPRHLAFLERTRKLTPQEAAALLDAYQAERATRDQIAAGKLDARTLWTFNTQTRRWERV